MAGDPTTLRPPSPMFDDLGKLITDDAPAELSEIQWHPARSTWPSSGPLLRLAVELLPEISDESLADLVEELAILLSERDEQIAAIRQVLSVALDNLHRAQLANARLRDHVTEVHDEVRQLKASHAHTQLRIANIESKHKKEEQQAGIEGTVDVDMRTKLSGSLLSCADVENLGGVYVGEVATVVEEDVRSPGTGRTARDAVVEFKDKTRWVPSNAAKRTLIGMFGFETDSWRGKTIEINLRERRGQLEKFVAEPDEAETPHARGGGENEGTTPPPPTTSEPEADADNFRP